MANEIQPVSFDPSKLEFFAVRGTERAEPKIDAQPFETWLQTAISTSDCVAAFQEFRKEEQLGPWTMWFNELHFGLHGEAKLIYGLPPMYEEQTVDVRAGDVYLIPIGASTRWEVKGDGPYRFLWAAMPRPRWLEL